MRKFLLVVVILVMTGVLVYAGFALAAPDRPARQPAAPSHLGPPRDESTLYVA